MVMGIFMAMLLVGALYYVWGIGGAILFREKMQDAADTAAFGAAVIHARGMNIVVILNVIMCALAAIEAGLHTAADGIEYASIAADLTCLGCGPWCAYCCRACPYVPAYFAASRTADSVYDSAKPFLDQLMTATHAAAVAVRTGTPIAAIGLVAEYGLVAPYNPTTTTPGLMLPLTRSLQTEDDPTDQPCDDRVYWPAAAVAATASLLEISFNVSEWYAGGMALAMLLDHEDNSREYCPDYFQRVPEDSELGEEPFQIRTFMLGASPFSWTRGGVALANWGRDTDSSISDTLEYASRISFAQSEYFYDNVNDDPREDFLWHQRWRARLRRFRFGGDMSGCTIPGCGALETFSAMVVH